MIMTQQNDPRPKNMYNITYWTSFGLTTKKKVPDYLIEDGYYWGPSGPKAIMKIINYKEKNGTTISIS